jgi:hypothetical protein
MEKTMATPTSNSRVVEDDELDAVSGGMKWDHNYVSPNIIDVRGGSVTVWGVTFGFDVNGKLSSVTGAGKDRPIG